MNHIKGAAPIVSPLVSAENWLIKGEKKMTLFTLAGALISASDVCCAALATSAALHNRFFEGFLSLAKKGIEREDNNKKRGENRGNKFIHVWTSCSKVTQMDMIAGLFFLPVVSPLFVGFSLFSTNYYACAGRGNRRGQLDP